MDRVIISSIQDSESAIIWFELFSKALDYFQSKGFLKGEKIICSVTAQGGTFVLLDDSFKPVSDVYSWTKMAKSDVVGELVSCFDKKQ